MTVRPGNARTIYLAVQADKATLATTPTIKLRIRDLSKNPVRNIIALEETDASTQEGASVVAGFAPGGSLAAYLRPSEVDLLMLGILGSSVDTGVGPNFVHTISPTVDTPYLTVWEVEPDGTFCNRFGGCRLTQLTAQGGQGQPLELTGIQFEALKFAAGVTPPVAPADPFDELPYIYPEVTVNRGGPTLGDVDQFSVLINRNGQRLGGDSGFGSFDYANGKFQVQVNITQFFSTEDDLRGTDTGDVAGTAPTPTIRTQTLSIIALRNANTSIEIASTKLSIVTATAGVNTDGSPLTQVIAARTEPTADIADNLTVIVKNAIATADHA